MENREICPRYAKERLWILIYFQRGESTAPKKKHALREAFCEPGLLNQIQSIPHASLAPNVALDGSRAAFGRFWLWTALGESSHREFSGSFWIFGEKSPFLGVRLLQPDSPPKNVHIDVFKRWRTGKFAPDMPRNVFGF